LSELALWFITCGTSEANTERILSMQCNIARLHEIVGLPPMETRLREWINRRPQVPLTIGAMGEGDELEGSDTEEVS
jgi:hypothetical protein